jgi:hypothetical protein
LVARQRMLTPPERQVVQVCKVRHRLPRLPADLEYVADYAQRRSQAVEPRADVGDGSAVRVIAAGQFGGRIGQFVVG